MNITVTDLAKLRVSHQNDHEFNALQEELNWMKFSGKQTNNNLFYLWVHNRYQQAFHFIAFVIRSTYLSAY